MRSIDSMQRETQGGGSGKARKGYSNFGGHRKTQKIKPKDVNKNKSVTVVETHTHTQAATDGTISSITNYVSLFERRT